MEKIQQLLVLLASPEDLTEDDLVQIGSELVAAFAEFTAAMESGEVPATDESMALAAEAEVALGKVYEIQNEREDAQAERLAALAEMRARVLPTAETPTEPETPDGDQPEGEGDEGEGEGDAAGEPEAAAPEVAEPIAAAVETPAAPAPRRVPLALQREQMPAASRPRPAANDEPRGPKITAAPDQRNYFTGQNIDFEQAVLAMSDAAEQSRRYGGPSLDHRVGTIDWRDQYPRDRVIDKSTRVDASQVDGMIRKVVGDVPGYDMSVIVPRQPGMSASGGICAPVTVRYELAQVSAADRPLRDGLVAFNADRGGIQFNSPPHLVDILADTTSAALTTVTNANDVSAVTKTVQEVACGTLNTVQVRAIAARLQFSNFGDRYNPERMRAYIALGLAAQARLAERELLEDMRAASTVVNGGVVELGAARQWVEQVDTVVTAMRYRHRMASGYPMNAVVPMWLATVVEIDLLKQQPGDGVVTGTPLDGMAWIEGQLRADNVRVIWQRDDGRTNNSQGAGAPAFTAQTGGGAALQDVPARVETIIFPEGSFLFLDGGQLDFGVTRDSTLNAANRFQTFYETFEGVAFVGVESIDLTTLICASGASSLPIAGKCGAVGS